MLNEEGMEIGTEMFLFAGKTQLLKILIHILEMPVGCHPQAGQQARQGPAVNTG